MIPILNSSKYFIFNHHHIIMVVGRRYLLFLYNNQVPVLGSMYIFYYYSSRIYDELPMVYVITLIPDDINSVGKKQLKSKGRRSR